MLLSPMVCKGDPYSENQTSSCNLSVAGSCGCARPMVAAVCILQMKSVRLLKIHPVAEYASESTNE